jgi:hypothetical protein
MSRFQLGTKPWHLRETLKGVIDRLKKPQANARIVLSNINGNLSDVNLGLRCNAQMKRHG